MTFTAAQAWAIFLSVAALSGITVAGMAWMIWKIVDYFRSWVIWWNEDAGRVEVERRRIKTSEITRGKAKGARLYYLNAKARKAANRGNAYVIDVDTGANLRGPGFNEIPEQVKEDDLQVFRICDPRFAYNKSKNNSYKNWLKTQEGDEDWRVKVAPLAFIAITVVVLVAGFVVFMMQKNGAA